MKRHQAILSKGFVLLWTNSPSLHQTYSLESWLTGTVFKILHARQSEIHVQFVGNILFNLCKNIRRLFRKLKQIQTLQGLALFFSKSEIYHSIAIPLALDLPLAKLQNAGSMQTC